MCVSFAQCFLYGIAFGQIGSVTASFYNEVVFDTPPGTSKGLAWAAYSALIGWGIGVVHDAIMPSIVFNKRTASWGMPTAYLISMVGGGAILSYLFFIEGKFAGLILFGLIDLPKAAHNFYSLLGAGALVTEPRLRPSSFAVRAAWTQCGLLIGSIIGSFLAEKLGFRAIMLLAAGFSVLNGIAGAAVGAVEVPKFAGVATNANPLWRFLVGTGEALNPEV